MAPWGHHAGLHRPAERTENGRSGLLTRFLTRCRENCAKRRMASILLNTLISAQHEINRITALENFILGFRLGVRLMAECMDEDDGDLVDGGGH